MGVGRSMPEKKQRALLGHEFGHGLTRDTYCSPKSKTTKGRGRKRTHCTYTGEHDSRFYKVTDRIHRTLRTNRRAARELEVGSGYNPPDDWLKPKRARGQARKRRSITGLRRW